MSVRIIINNKMVKLFCVNNTLKFSVEGGDVRIFLNEHEEDRLTVRNSSLGAILHMVVDRCVDGGLIGREEGEQFITDNI